MTDEDRDPRPGWPDWLGLVVADLDAARRFYADLFGCEPADTGEDWVQFDLGDGRIFELLRHDTARVQYDGTRFQPGFPVDDMERASDRLIRLGAERITDVEGGPDHGGLWCYFRDPQGHVFELTQPMPPSSPAPDSTDRPLDGLR